MGSRPRSPQATLESLSREECLQRLAQHTVGRLAVVLDGRPHILPLNYAVDERGVIVFRTAELTVASEATLRHVAFEIDEIDVARREGWSVTVHGFGREITGGIDADSVRLMQLPVQPWVPGERDRWYTVTPAEITGRVLRAAPASA